MDDMAAACVHIMDLPLETYHSNTQAMVSHINVGSGVDCTIRELAEAIARVTGFAGRLIFDSSKPEGAARKLLDVSRLTGLGWSASISLEAGLKDAYHWYVSNEVQARGRLNA